MSNSFGVGNGRVPEIIARGLDRIAKRHGATFIAVVLPEGPRYWFDAQSLGEPFDGATRRAVLDEAQREGLWPIRKERRR